MSVTRVKRGCSELVGSRPTSRRLGPSRGTVDRERAARAVRDIEPEIERVIEAAGALIDRMAS